MFSKFSLLDFPVTPSPSSVMVGKTSTKYEQDVAYGKFSGFVSHYHVSKRKIDCAGLDIKALLNEIAEDE